MNGVKFVVGDINYLVAEVQWAGPQSNCNVWTVILLSKNSCAMTNDYNFWPNGKLSIPTIFKQGKVD